MFIDSHCHLELLDISQYENGLTDVLAEAKARGVEHLLSVSVELDKLDTLLTQAESFDDISVSCGLHPNETPEYIPSVEELIRLADHKKIVAIGETGLDTYRTPGDIDWQITRFRHHIRAANYLKKPLIIHTRAVGQQTLDIMEEEGIADCGAVIHCFTEDEAYAKRALDLGCYISFSGIVTFKNAKALQEVAKIVPLNRLLIETDAPFLTPVPYRGKPNYPKHVVDVALFLADFLNKPIETIAAETTVNFYTLFSQANRDGKNIPGIT